MHKSTVSLSSVAVPPPQWFLYFYPEGYMLRNGGGGVRVTENRMGSRVCACDNKNNL